MQRTTRTTQNGTCRPVGFSLVELLVVISIIIALIAIAIPTIGNIMNSANRAATLATLEKADSLLKDQIAAFNRKYAESADVIALKQEFRRAFPQTAAEAAMSSAHTGWSADNNEYDSSELLYITLTKGRYSGAGSTEQVEFSGSELADADADNFMELVDAWGNPLRFYRWPTRLLNPYGFVASRLSDSIDASSTGSLSIVSQELGGMSFSEVWSALQGANASAKMYVVIGREIIQVQNDLQVVQRGALNTDAEAHAAGSLVKLAAFPQLISLAFASLNSASVIRDPDDPRGALLPPNTDSTTFENNLHTLDSYHTPLIVSAGSDEVLGLLEPSVDGSGSWDRGNLAQPDTAGGTNFTAIADPGSTPLADNLTNLTGGLSN